MVTLAQKVRFLSDPRSYPHGPASVEVIETHMSFVFLAGNLAFKFKKPVHFPFLDHSTLAARQANCAQELHLNQRLEGKTYRRVLPLTETPTGDLQIQGNGRVVEWLVEMERLPNEQTLDCQIERNVVQRGDIIAVAEKLAHYYQGCTPQISDGPLYLKHLAHEQSVNRKLLTRAEFGLANDAGIAILDEVEQQMDGVQAEIEARIARGFIIEGHGDLRPAHVYLGTPVHIIDCLEFDRSMRILDPYDEVNYLGLECQFLGVNWIRPLLLETLNAHLGEQPSPSLMAFYSVFRAVLRARISIAHLLDSQPATPEIWPGRARAYLKLAHAECLLGSTRQKATD